VDPHRRPLPPQHSDEAEHDSRTLRQAGPLAGALSALAAVSLMGEALSALAAAASALAVTASALVATASAPASL